MPRYKYTCGTCELDDVKSFHYRLNPETGHIDLKVCAWCGNKVLRKFDKPPKEWFNKQKKV